MDSLLHDSLAQLPPADLEKQAKSKYTNRLILLETLNLVCLMIFGVTWVLNFIFVGWYGAYAVILIYSWFYTVVSGIFVIGRHS
jgi:hypothetical protein